MAGDGRREGILSDVLIILRGSIVAQVISFGALPFLARLYAPAAFGNYQVFMAIAGFLLLSASLRYEVAILTAETDGCAVGISRLCLLINVAFSSIVALCCAVLHVAFPAAVNSLGNALWLMPVLLLAGGAYQTWTYVLLRSSAFRASSTAKGLQAIGYTACGLSWGAAHASAVGLAMAEVMGKVVAFAYAYRKGPKRFSGFQRDQVGAGTLLGLAARFREFPLVSLPGSLLNNTGAILTPLMMFGIFGASVAGQYALVERCVSVPIAVISQAVSQVFMASFSASIRAGHAEARHLFVKVVLGNLRLAIGPAIIATLFGRYLFAVVFGPRWQIAGDFLQALSPMLLASFLVAPVDMALQILNRQAVNFVWHVCRLILVLSAWGLVTIADLRPMSAIVLHSAVNTLAYLGLLWLIHRSIVQATDSPSGRQGLSASEGMTPRPPKRQ